jgi:hypothetical protein
MITGGLEVGGPDDHPRRRSAAAINYNLILNAINYHQSTIADC